MKHCPVSLGPHPNIQATTAEVAPLHLCTLSPPPSTPPPHTHLDMSSPPQASNTIQYRFLVNATQDSSYYVRVFALQFDLSWGPPRLSDPLVTTPRLVVVDVVQGGQNIPLANGIVVIKMLNMGSGPYVAALPVTAQMVNGTGGAAYNVRETRCSPPPSLADVHAPFNVFLAHCGEQATNCQIDIDGERVVCDTPEGVGGMYQWAITVRNACPLPCRQAPS
jgi:hypothetical protein